VKLAVIGGGGFRTPGLAAALLDERELDFGEIALHDLDAGRLARIELVLRGLCEERGASPPFRTTTDLDDALEGADFVCCAIRVGGLAGRLVDESVPLALGLLGQETVGAGGLTYALRTLPAMLTIAERVATRAPSAWFLNYTNPAGLVTEALQEILGSRAIGICDAPPTLFAGVARALGRDEGRLDFDYGGLNHLGWLKAVREDGRDLLPELLADDERLTTFTEGVVFPAELLRTLGRIPNEYLAYYYATRDIVAVLQREGPRARTLLEQERAFYDRADADSPSEALAAWRATLRRRSASYFAEVHGGGSEDELPPDGGLAGYTGVALGVVRALVTGKPARIVLDVANAGTIPFLDERAVVEVPCDVERAGVRPVSSSPWTLHEQGLISTVKDVERVTIAAAAAGSRSLAVRAVALHPLVASVEAARTVLDRHPELGGLLR
jgi:6-phospho-beta-glucosidase